MFQQLRFLAQYRIPGRSLFQHPTLNQQVGERFGLVFFHSGHRIPIQEPGIFLGVLRDRTVTLGVFASRAIFEAPGIQRRPAFICIQQPIIAIVNEVVVLVMDDFADIKFIRAATSTS